MRSRRRTPSGRTRTAATAIRLSISVTSHSRRRDGYKFISGPHTDRLLAIGLPPGLGKTTAVSEVGAASKEYPEGELNIAWIAPRTDMGTSTPALRRYHHRKPATAENCSEPERARMRAKKGLNATTLHASHNCAYSRQHIDQQGSTVYQVAHVSTPYVLNHVGGIVIDELDLSRWLQDYTAALSDIVLRLAGFLREARRNNCLTRLSRRSARLTASVGGKQAFDDLNQRCDGHLEELIVALAQEPEATQVRPTRRFTSVEEELATPPVVLPHLYRVLRDELPFWQRGHEWNSLLRLDPPEPVLG